MKPASKRSARSRVTIALGPMNVEVDVYGGIADAESPATYCVGTDDAPHEHTKPTSLGTNCSVCGAHGNRVKAYKADTGELVTLDAGADAKRLTSVEPLRDRLALNVVDPEMLDASAIDAGKRYWLVPTGREAETEVYAGLVKAISDGLTVVTCWASRTAGKLYRLGVAGDTLTLVEMADATQLRACPERPAAKLEQQKVDFAATMWAMAGQVSTIATQEELLELAQDPGRNALREAANAALLAADSTVLKIERGDRATFDDRLAEAALNALMEKLAAQTKASKESRS